MGSMAGVKAYDVTLVQTEPTANLRDPFAMPPNADFTPLTVPIVPGNNTAIEWFIFL